MQPLVTLALAPREEALSPFYLEVRQKLHYKVPDCPLSFLIFTRRPCWQIHIALFSVSLDCKSVGSGLRPLEGTEAAGQPPGPLRRRGSSRKKWCPCQPFLKVSPFPMHTSQAGARASNNPKSLNWVQSVWEGVVFLRHELRQKCSSQLLPPKGDCWSGSQIHT